MPSKLLWVKLAIDTDPEKNAWRIKHPLCKSGLMGFFKKNHSTPLINVSIYTEKIVKDNKENDFKCPWKLECSCNFSFTFIKCSLKVSFSEVWRFEHYWYRVFIYISSLVEEKKMYLFIYTPRLSHRI